jgi:hypothetical protein
MGEGWRSAAHKFRFKSRFTLMQYMFGRALFRLFAGDELVAAARTIQDITETVRSLGPDTYHVEEIIDGERVNNRHVSRFWGWVSYDCDGTVSIEPCFSVLEG